jgi:hypothetical protein
LDGTAGDGAAVVTQVQFLNPNCSAAILRSSVIPTPSATLRVNSAEGSPILVILNLFQDPP